MNAVNHINVAGSQLSRERYYGWITWRGSGQRRDITTSRLMCGHGDMKVEIIELSVVALKLAGRQDLDGFSDER